jgi:hypothetical protein
VTTRRSLFLLIAAHVLFSGAIATVFAHRFDQDSQEIAGHILLIAEWDLAIAAMLIALAKVRLKASWAAFCSLLIVTSTLQVYLYALDAISNASWARERCGRGKSAFRSASWESRRRHSAYSQSSPY